MTTRALEMPAAPESSPGVRFAEAAAFSLFIGLCAQLQIRLPFTPVPITGQTLAVLLAGAVLGSRRGALAVAMYLAEGGLGLPFFAGGAAGAVHFLGPTGGYLLGFVPAAWVTGRLMERGWGETPLRAAALMAAGSAVVFAFGLAGLSRFVPGDQLLALGLWPFLPGDVIKVGLASAALPAWRRFSFLD